MTTAKRVGDLQSFGECFDLLRMVKAYPNFYFHSIFALPFVL